MPKRSGTTATSRCRGALAELPPILEPDYVAHYRKAPNMPYKNLTSVTYDGPWECGYCAYHHTTTEGTTMPDSPCKPWNHEPIEAAKSVKGAWSYDARYGPGAVAFIQGLEQRVPIEEAGDE